METKNENDNSYFSDISSRDYTSDELLAQWLIPTASVFFRTDYWHQIPVNSSFWCGNVIIQLTMCSFGKVHAFSDKMSVYRLTSTGALNMFYQSETAERIGRMKKHIQSLREAFPNLVSKKFCHSQFLKLDYEYLLDVKQKAGISKARKEFLNLPLRTQIGILCYYINYRFKTINQKF